MAQSGGPVRGGQLIDFDSIRNGDHLIRIDSVGADGLLAHRAGNGLHLVKERAHQAIGDAVPGRAQNAHVAAAGYHHRNAAQLGDETAQQVGRFEERVDDLHALGLDEPSEIERRPKRSHAEDPLDRKLPDGTGELLECRRFRPQAEGADGAPVAILRQQFRDAQQHSFGAPKSPQDVDEIEDVDGAASGRSYTLFDGLRM